MSSKNQPDSTRESHSNKTPDTREDFGPSMF